VDATGLAASTAASIVKLPAFGVPSMISVSTSSASLT